jgi:hypothetical protein
VGTFVIDPTATAITISGTFGNSFAPSSSGVDLFLGSILVSQCVAFATCYNNIEPWSTTLTPAQIALLGAGTVNFTAVQTSQFYIRLGETTLTQITASPVPEPSTLLLLATGGLAAAGSMRRRLRLS